jgi:hypothetical protein
MIAALEQHGYQLPSEQPARNHAHADSLVALHRLVAAFEGEAN